MLNSKKFLYVLPDLAYVAELMPKKKAHEFSIQAFKQINGEFIDDNNLIETNLKKLVDKLDEEEYQLILPDYLFTNTIVEVEEKSESAVKEHIKDKLLPSLKISKDTHEIKTHILNAYSGKTRVQLCALEKIVLEPLRKALDHKKIKITGISPLSWTIKSLISLEPSISIVQIGSKLYLAEHYIGIDQCSSQDIENIDSISETIKTLKGAQPSIQTIYLLSNPLIEKKLKDELSGTLPIQQLASDAESEDKLPNFVKQIIEASSKTLDISDFPVPQFPLGKSVATMTKTNDKTTENTQVEEVENKEAKIETVEIFEEDEEENDLPKPNSNDQEPKLEEEKVLENEEEKAEPDISQFAPENDNLENSNKPAEVEDIEIKLEKAAEEKEEEKEEEEEENAEDIKNQKNEVSQETEKISEKTISKPKSNFGKTLFVTLTVFFITVAVGIGIGLLILRLNNRQVSQETSPTNVVEESPEVTPEATPEPTPEPVSIDNSDYSVLVLNATTIAGQAGEIADALEDAEFQNVDAGNARGDYQEGFYVLLDEENAALVDALSEASGLELEYDDETDKSVEDSSDNYDAVVVLVGDISEE